MGTILSARERAGDFMLDPSSPRPVVLVSAGVGLTPLVSMLHELFDGSDGRRVWFVHGARDGRHHALADEVRCLAERAPNVRLHVAYSRPRPEDGLGRHYHSAGRTWRLGACPPSELDPLASKTFAGRGRGSSKSRSYASELAELRNLVEAAGIEPGSERRKSPKTKKPDS